MPGRNFLFVPGPTNVPERIQRAMHRGMEDHRSSSFPELTRAVLPRLPQVFGSSDGQAFVFPATGTGMWETAIVNTRSPGDRVLAVRNGQFSHLFIECAERHGLVVEVINGEWGEGAPADEIGARLARDTAREIRGVLVVHNETATGVTSDVGAVRAAIDAAGHPALLYVDGVSSIGSLPFRMDAWRVDCAITGSQKGFMLPAGLGILCMSPRALAAMETARCARYFFDLRQMAAANATGYFPYTPALTLLYGLRESLDVMLEEGLDRVFARHHRLAGGVRRAVRAWGLELCARRPEIYSDTVSAILVPAGVNGADVIDVAYRRYDLALGAGLARLAGKLFRIGHLGDLNELMLLGALAGAEMAMRDVGIDVTPGSGVAAAAEYYRETAAPLPPRAGGAVSPDARAIHRPAAAGAAR
jgi:alanine-glyoxylate transaminase/serine-glyoxylate transaminase/serine-pyruvate transaminase